MSAPNDINVKFSPTKILILSLILLVLGICGYVLVNNSLLKYIFAHVGGLGIISILSCLVGFTATRKGYSYWKAFAICLISSIMSGVVAAGIVNGMGGRGCGGSVSLATALIIILFYSLAKNVRLNK